jgi:hypothetical protein
VWGGLAKNIPEHYKIPSVTLPHAFQLWHCGSDDPKNPPISLCQVSKTDFSNAKHRKMFSWYKFVMKFTQGKSRVDGSQMLQFEMDAKAQLSKKKHKVDFPKS